jgi:acyl dehydratase
MTSLATITPGYELTSDWLTISQERINAFAEATDDRQWVHLDVERAKRESPYGATIAHGFLTLSLLAHFLEKSISFDDAVMSVNYGLNKVRFIAPVIAGSRIRARFHVASAQSKEKETKLFWTITIEREGTDKPACAAEWITLHYRG